MDLTTAWFEPIFEPITITRWLYLPVLGVFGWFLWQVALWLWQQEDRRKLLLPAWLLLIGLGLRLWWIGASQPDPLSDFEVYWQYANAFAQGEMTYQELSRHPGIVVLYSWMIAWFGRSLWSGWVMNLMFAAAMMVLTYATARQMFGYWAGVWALGLTALLPQLVTYTALIATETVTTAFFLMVVWLALQSRSQKTFQPGFWVAFGVLLYGTVLIRSSSLLFLALIPLIVLLFRQDRLALAAKQMAVLGLTTVVLLSSWLLHQKAIGGSYKLFWGDELWLACAVQYDHDSRYVNPRHWAFYPKLKPHYDLKTQAGMIEAYRVAGEEAKKIIAADPVRYLKSGLTRMRYILWSSQTGVRWSHKGSALLQQWPQRIINKMANVSTIVWQVVLCLSVLGLLTYRKRGPWPLKEGWTLMVCFVAVWALFHYAVAYSNERYNFQIIPFVLIFTAGGLTAIPGWIRSYLNPEPYGVVMDGTNPMAGQLQ